MMEVTNLCSGNPGQRSVQLELPESSCTSRMNSSFRNPFMIKVADLLSVVEVFEQGGTAIACMQGFVGLIHSRQQVSGPVKPRLTAIWTPK